MPIPYTNKGYEDADEYSQAPVLTPEVDRDHHEYSIGMDAFMLETLGALVALAGNIVGIDPFVHVWNSVINSDIIIPDTRRGLIVGPTTIEDGVTIETQGDAEVVFIDIATLAALQPQA